MDSRRKILPPSHDVKLPSILIIVTIMQMRNAIMIIAFILAPTQTMIIGPRAIFGRAFSTTR